MMTQAELEYACGSILAATNPEAVFGREIARDELNAKYREIAKVVHPDQFAGKPSAETATKAFRQLTVLRDAALAKFDTGTYGDLKATAAPEPKRGPVVIQVRSAKYVVGDLLAKGDIADVYLCTDPASCVLKIAQRPADNDLLENEAKRIEKLRPKTGADNFARYIPKLVDSFTLKGDKSARRVNVLKYYGDHVSLEAVNKRYPKGLDYRDAAWMVKRLLEGLGNAHQKGIVHGAILPPHLIVHPVDHGAKIIGWGCAVDTGQPLKVISARWRDHYPPEVFAKKPATPAADVFMASKLALWLIGDGFCPRAVSDLFRANLIVQRARHQDAWALHDDLSKLLEQLNGPPKYRELAL